MATTKTFKTRIKLKYDSAANWLPNGAKFQGLAGELLIGSDDKYLRIGTGDNTGWEFAKISGAEVDIAGYSINTIKTAQAAITDLDNRINDIVTDGVVTSFGGKTGAITLNPDSGLSISNNNVLTIAKATDSQLGVVKVTTGNGLAITDGVIRMNVATADTAGAVKVNANNGLSLSDGTISMAAASASANGAMSKEDFTKLLGIEAGAEVNDIVAVQVNGADLTPDGSRAVNITIAESTENGKITVNGTDVAVHGLGSAAYTEADEYATAEQGGKADTALQSISKGTDGTFVTTTVSAKGEGTTQTVGVSVTTLDVEDAIGGANGLATAADVKSYVDTQITNLAGALIYEGTIDAYPASVPTGAQSGSVYVVSEGFEHDDQKYEAGDMFIYNGSGWNVVNGENQVENANATITAGNGPTKVATVDGTDIIVGVQVASGSATIATVSGGVVTLKGGVTQTGTTGTIGNTSGTDITLAKVATTGKAVDVAVDVNLIEATNVEGALAEIVEKVNTNAEAIEANAEAIEANTQAIEANTTAIEANGELIAANTTAIEANGELIAANTTAIEANTTAISNLHQVARTGKISDLVQAETTTTDGFTNTDDMIIFDCGSATVNTLTED